MLQGEVKVNLSETSPWTASQKEGGFLQGGTVWQASCERAGVEEPARKPRLHALET